jgi:site-specific DNA-methyltransferase (adenine-specific)
VRKKKSGCRLVEGNSYEFLKRHRGKAFCAAVTDPPYGIGVIGMDGKKWDNGFPHPVFWRALRSRIDEGGWLASFCGVRTYHRSALAIEEGGWTIQDVLAWIRPYAIGRKSGLKRGWEAIILASNGIPRPLNIRDARVRGAGIPKWPSQSLPDNNRALSMKRGNPSNRQETRSPSSVVLAAEDEGLLGEYDRFFIVGRSPTKEKGEFNTHPTVKPVSLIEHLLLLVQRPGGTVLDPFAGSGSTLVAAKRLGIGCVGVEINPGYAEIARRRIKAAGAHGGSRARDGQKHGVVSRDSVVPSVQLSLV